MKKCILVLVVGLLGCPDKERRPDEIVPTNNAPTTSQRRIKIDPTVIHKRMAVGAKFDVPVFETDGSTPVVIDTARFDNVPVAVVSKIENNLITLEAISSGSSTLLFTGDNETASGGQSLQFVEPTETTLIHLCQRADQRETQALYLAGTNDVSIWYTLRDEHDRLHGYGFNPFELTDGAQFRTDQNEDQRYLHIDLGSQTGDVQLTSTIDDTEIILSIAEEQDINGIEQDSEFPAIVPAGESVVTRFLPTIDDVRVCGAKARFEFQTTTPDICDVTQGTPTIDWADGLSGFLTVHGKAPGAC